MKTLIFDIETDGFLEDLTTIHSLVIRDMETGEVYSCWPNDADTGPNYHSIVFGLKKLMEADLIVGHNVIQFDIPAIKKLYPWFNEPKVRDTLVMSRLVYSDMKQADFAMRRRKERKGQEWIPGNLIGKHSLEAWGYRLGEWKGDYAKIKQAEAKEQGIPKDQWSDYVWGNWTKDMQDYCEQDVVVTEKLWSKLCGKLVEWGIDPFDFNPPAGKDCLQLEHDVAVITDRQARYGVAFDEKKAAALYSTLTKRQAELEAELQEVFKPWWRDRGRVVSKASRSVKRDDLPYTVTLRRFSEKTGKELKPYVGPVKEHYTEGILHHKVELVPFNPGSRDDVADRLIKLRGWKPLEYTKDGKPQVSDEVLEKLDFPEAKLLSEYFMVQKRLGQLASGAKSWMQNVRPDGRISAAVISNGTVTGRMSHRGVANVPSVYDKKTGELLPYGRECRELFKASDGKVMVGVDADAIELRILAGYMARYDGGAYIKTVLEGDKSKGTDMHSVNAKALGGIFREAAKTWFYAFIYGAWYFKLGQEAGAKGTKSAIIKRGKETSAAFLKNLPALNKLINLAKKKANTVGFIRGLDGRRIPIRKENAALNTLLQSAGAILMKRGCVILDSVLRDERGFTPGKEYEFAINYHDEWQLDTEKEYAETVKEEAERAIESAGKFYDFACPLSGSGDIGPDWSATH